MYNPTFKVFFYNFLLVLDAFLKAISLLYSISVFFSYSMLSVVGDFCFSVSELLRLHLPEHNINHHHVLRQGVKEVFTLRFHTIESLLQRTKLVHNSSHHWGGIFHYPTLSPFFSWDPPPLHPQLQIFCREIFYFRRDNNALSQWFLVLFLFVWGGRGWPAGWTHFQPVSP